MIYSINQKIQFQGFFGLNNFWNQNIKKFTPKFTDSRSTYYLFNECKNLITLCPLKLYEYHDYGSIEICTKSLTWKLFLFFSQCKENSIYKYDLIKTTKNIFRHNICAKSKGKDCTYRISNFAIYIDSKIDIYTETNLLNTR